MAKVPSLLCLCIQVLKTQLVKGQDPLQDVYELPSDLFDNLVTHLSPLALHNLQSDIYGNFQGAWKALFKLRWPELVDRVQPDDWQQIYWETHLQNCLDEAAEVALRPSFDRYLGDIDVSGKILRHIICEEHTSHLARGCTKLSYHCERFGSYPRYLRLLNVLCVEETCELLRTSKLQTLVLRWIRSPEHIEGVHRLLTQNQETLTSLEFIHCKLSSSLLDVVCDSLSEKGSQMHRIQHFSIKSSSFEADTVLSPFRLFLKSGRSLESLKVCDTQLDKNFARMVFTTLLESNLSVLDLSDNNISGWLSCFNWRSTIVSGSALEAGKSLQSLRLLNLRGNELRKTDAENLRHALIRIPNLDALDLSDNPIGDDGIRSLIPYLVEASQSSSPLTSLKLENCDLSCNGATELLDTLSTLSTPLKSLSFADNGIGSHVSAALGNLMGTTPLQMLNISGIGFGSTGFQELQDKLTKELKLVDINISKNRGGLEVANFLLRLISCAPKLVTIDATYNLMPVESLATVCSALRNAQGHLKLLDLTGNTWDIRKDRYDTLLAEFQHNGKPILVLSLGLASNIPFDDDP